MTHAELVELGRRWLLKNNPVVLTEIGVTGENPDCIGFSGGISVLLEAKATRSDFLRDKHKYFRREGGAHGIGDFRYYITAPDVVKESDDIGKWGLLEVKNRKIFRVREAKRFDDTNKGHEQLILISVLRRIGQIAPTGVSISAYYYTTLNRASVSIDIEQDCEGEKAA